MPALATNADGNYIFMAVEDESTGNQLIVKAARADLSTWSVAYEPGAGSASNVAAVPGNPDLMLFYGNFDTDVTVILYTISTDTATDISPASLGAAAVNTLAVNPSNSDEIIITVNTSEDLLYTSDGGDNWATWNAALGFDATALWVLWSGQYEPYRIFTAGDDGATLNLLYSPNEGISFDDKAGATLGALANVTNIEVIEV